MSAFLSLKCLKDKNYHVKLVTDKLGKKYLIENFGLKYDEVTTELEDLDINPYLWGMAKMYAFSIQNEPFLYSDLDVFLFNDITDKLKGCDIFFQNHEQNYYTAYDTYSRFKQYFQSKTDAIYEYESKINDCKYGDGYNTAVFGGNDLTLIKNCTNEILEYCKLNMSGINNKYVGDRVSVFMEQVYFNNLLPDRYPEFHIKENLSERLDFYNKWREDYVHMITFEKYNLNMIRGMYKTIEKTNFEEYESKAWGLNYVDLLALTKDLK